MNDKELAEQHLKELYEREECKRARDEIRKWLLHSLFRDMQFFIKSFKTYSVGYYNKGYDFQGGKYNFPDFINIIKEVYENHISDVEIKKGNIIHNITESRSFLKDFKEELCIKLNDFLLKMRTERAGERANEFDSLIDLYQSDAASYEFAKMQLPNLGNDVHEVFADRYLFVRETIRYLKQLKSFTFSTNTFYFHWYFGYFSTEQF